jgi:hypothetical protein
VKRKPLTDSPEEEGNPFQSGRERCIMVSCSTFINPLVNIIASLTRKLHGNSLWISETNPVTVVLNFMGTPFFNQCCFCQNPSSVFDFFFAHGTIPSRSFHSCQIQEVPISTLATALR